MLLRLAIAALLAVTVAFVACGEDDESATTPDRLTVVATTTQAADLARNAGGDDVDVVGLLAPNADPHDYEVRPRDLELLQHADLVVRSGGDLDEWLQDAIDGAGTGAPVLDLSEHVRLIGDDPHWWQDPQNAERAVSAIAARLGTDASAYLERLRRLDDEVRSCLSTLKQRKLVTTHDALGYYAGRYGLEVVGTVIPSLSTRGQPSAGETAALIRTIRREGVDAIFPESSVNPKVEAAIARETGARVGEELYADTLGPGVDYVQAIERNTEAIAGHPCR